MKPYRSGYLLELKARDLLRKEGYIVIRSSRSLTPIDLVGINPEKKEIVLVQVKKAKIPKNQSKFRELWELAGHYRVRTLLYAKEEGRYRFKEGP
jgi:Holliday junction resolvase